MPKTHNRIGRFPVLARLAVPAVIAGAFAPGVASAQCTGFNLVQSSGAVIVPGTTDIGNHGDDVVTSLPLPFPVAMYGVIYNSAVASSNGTLQFTTSSNAYGNICLPSPDLGVSIMPHWDDLRTDGTGEGIFTSVTGVAPNRVMNIEWRTHYYSGAGTAGFEVRLFEDQSRVEVIYGDVTNGGTSATVGIQHTLYPSVQYACNTGGVGAGTLLTYTCTNGPISPAGIGAVSPTLVYACGTTSTALFTVTVTPGFNPTSTGLAVTANLQSVGGSATQTFYDNGTNGDVTAGDRVFSFRAAIPATVTPGNKSVAFTVTDAEMRSATGAMGLTATGCPVSGPDVFVADLIDIANDGAVGNITAYAVGTNACNAGDAPVSWFASVNQHPVIAQNMFRLKNGRFEQLGQSWLKHGFSSTNSPGCSPGCQSPAQGSAQLGVGCADAYGSGLNGGQGNLGPRSQVNATTGVYPYPFTAGAAPATIGRRLQVFTDDIDPALNSGAQYFVDCHYVTADDAQWTTGSGPAINGLNNASYRGIAISGTTATPTFTAATVQMQPAIKAWQAADATVQVVAADYLDTSINPVGITARFWVGAKVSANGNGTWHYEYAVYNFNADRAGGSFSVPVPPGVTVSNIGFHGIFAHSGEPYPNAAANMDNWVGTKAGNVVSWMTPEPYVAPGDTGNAIRWGTMYNFRFDADIAPVASVATIGLYKPAGVGSVTSVSAAVMTPGSRCGPADFNRDGAITVQDIFDYLAAYFSNDGHADFNGVGGVTVQDIFDFLAAYFVGCP